ncbi:hypothetical protein EVAR_25839_1 [Eumeta japonica]|uniref:Uncharacterized protein n=1 Tax=Eumeta variegata TaxID=151549 RepID=A0A4C1VV04_EUMVA|nr:hypothetical protein EVAR_25839_1 [Eumeta japonica]
MSEGLWRVGGRHSGIGRSTSKAGGPRSVRVCRSLKKASARFLQIALVDTVSCGVAAGGAADSDRQGGRVAGRRSATKKRIA